MNITNPRKRQGFRSRRNTPLADALQKPMPFLEGRESRGEWSRGGGEWIAILTTSTWLCQGAKMLWPLMSQNLDAAMREFCQVA